jgi:hypothetical protein
MPAIVWTAAAAVYGSGPLASGNASVTYIDSSGASVWSSLTPVT